MIVRFTLPLLAVALAGCVSAPAYRYYTLDMNPRAEIAAPIALDGVRVRVNEALARPEILVRISPTQIEYYAIDRWAGGLEEQIAEKLKTEFGDPQAGPYRVRIDALLMAFEQVDTATGADVQVKLDTNIEISGRDRSDEPISFNRLYMRTDAAESATAASAVEALSRALESIAAQMAADIQERVGVVADETPPS